MYAAMPAAGHAAGVGRLHVVGLHAFGKSGSKLHTASASQPGVRRASGRAVLARPQRRQLSRKRRDVCCQGLQEGRVLGQLLLQGGAHLGRQEGQAARASRQRGVT